MELFLKGQGEALLEDNEQVEDPDPCVDGERPPRKHQMSTQCCFNFVPASQPVDQLWNDSGWTTFVCRVQARYIYISLY